MTIYLSNRDGDGKTNEEGHLRLLSRILTGDVLAPTDLQVTQNSPLGLSVIVKKGDYRLETSGGSYAYMGWLDSDAVVSISVPNPSNPRITSIVLYVDKSATTSPSPPNNPGITKLIAVNGTASSSPTPPSSSTILDVIGSNNPYVVLADVTVGAGATQVTNSNITDSRETIKLTESILSANALVQTVGPLLFPVGSIYTNANDNTNPATLLGFGTWAQFAEGRTPVGVNTADTDFGSPGKTGGVKNVSLTTGQMPNHNHLINPPTTTTSTTGNHSHALGNYGTWGSFGTVDSDNASSSGSKRTGTDGAHNHTVNIPPFYSSNAGAGMPHTNLQPYITVYMWRRVS